MTVKDKGTQYFPISQHEFASKKLSEKAKQEAGQEFSELARQEYEKVPGFNIRRVTAPIDYPERLKKQEPERYKTFKKKV